MSVLNLFINSIAQVILFTVIPLSWWLISGLAAARPSKPCFFTFHDVQLVLII